MYQHLHVPASSCSPATAAVLAFYTSSLMLKTTCVMMIRIDEHSPFAAVAIAVAFESPHFYQMLMAL
jgi:hypothetical protein